tara:strand:+ start:536 stop:886 length:351 start_codon:yes stop_codon:yes gene_type:complete
VTTKATNTQGEKQLLTKLEAIEEIDEMGSHTIVAGKWANKVGKPFNVTFTEHEFKYARNEPKGPLYDCYGVDMGDITRTIVKSIGAKTHPMRGRGSQFRADVKAIRDVISNGEGAA